MPLDSNKLFYIDFALIIIISVAITVAADQLAFMTVLIPALFVVRMILLSIKRKELGVNVPAEIIFLIICTLLGGFNDWNSVCNKKIYDYTVPYYFEFSTIPIWMLLYWGLILRFFARFARWERLNPPAAVSNRVGFGSLAIDSAPLKVILQLALVFATRQTIYRFYLDPILSWAPFAGALVVYALLFKPTLHDLKLVGIFALGGPLIEDLYINVGGLHKYHLGWLGGTPLWIALWWLVIILIWKDFAYRIEHTLRTKLFAGA